MVEEKFYKQNESVIFIFGLCPLIPTTSNFAYGLIMAIMVWLVFFSGIFAKLISDMLELKKGVKFFTSIFVISLATAFNFLLQGIFPIVQGAIQIYIYILSFSYIIYLSLADYYSNTESLEFPASYSILLLIIAALRELFAFGSISLPAPSGFISLKVFFFLEQPPFRFLGSNAGALILLGLALWIYKSIENGSLLPFKGGK